jgi:hypothetical protein
MTPITEQRPPDNAMCRVQALPGMKIVGPEYRFVSMSDGDFCWDNLVNEVLQSTEVTHWELAA